MHLSMFLKNYYCRFHVKNVGNFRCFFLPCWYRALKKAVHTFYIPNSSTHQSPCQCFVRKHRFLQLLLPSFTWHHFVSVIIRCESTTKPFLIFFMHTFVTSHPTTLNCVVECPCFGSGYFIATYPKLVLRNYEKNG